MRFSLVVILLFTLKSGFAASPAMDIYVIDVEGGKATLVVAPSGESLLIDTGNLGEGARRDVERIMTAIQDAELKQIDHLVTTHWHRDHFGGIALLASRIPIREFIDHGANVQPDEQTDAFLQQTYAALNAGANHTVVKPGDRIAVGGLDALILTSGGEAIKDPLPGAGKSNPYCAGFKRQNPDTTENSQSIGLLISYGKFRVLDLGDLTANKEFDLMCPDNPIGTVDLFMVSHHGQATSNFDVLVHAIEPRVAIMNNGMRKGGQPSVMEVLYSAPGLEDLWQLHSSLLSGQEYTVPGLFIANLPDTPDLAMPIAPMSFEGSKDAGTPKPIHNGIAYWIKVSAQQDGSFTVTNGRNGFSKTYKARRTGQLQSDFDTRGGLILPAGSASALACNSTTKAGANPNFQPHLSVR